MQVKRIDVQVAGKAWTPSTGLGTVALNVSAKGTVGGTLAIYSPDDAEPITTSLSYGTTSYATNLVMSKVGANGKIKLVNKGTASTNVYLDLHGYTVTAAGISTATTASIYVPVAPVRILTDITIPAYGNYEMQPLGLGGVPASGVRAVSATISALSTTTSTIRVYAAGEWWPDDAALDLEPNKPSSNYVIGEIGTGGKVNVHNFGGAPVKISVDVSGYFANDSTAAERSGIYGLKPNRLAANVSIPANEDYVLAPRGQGDVPPTLVGAVGFEVTATGASNGALEIRPSDQPATGLPTLSYGAGTPANRFTLTNLGADGTVIVHNSGTSPAMVSVDTIAYTEFSVWRQPTVPDMKDVADDPVVAGTDPVDLTTDDRDADVAEDIPFDEDITVAEVSEPDGETSGLAAKAVLPGCYSYNLVYADSSSRMVASGIGSCQFRVPAVTVSTNLARKRWWGLYTGIDTASVYKENVSSAGASVRKGCYYWTKTTYRSRVTSAIYAKGQWWRSPETSDYITWNCHTGKRE